MRRLFYALCILITVIVFEIGFVALSTGSMDLRYKSPVLQDFGYFIALLQQEPLESLNLFFVHKPVFMIESRHALVDTNVWALHYFATTVLVHVLIALLIAHIGVASASTLRWRDIPFAGSVLLLFSSLYLLLTSCCTGGSHWIFHTWLLSLVFNPITSSTATIQLYQSLKDWFVVLQLLCGVAGMYLIIRHRRRSMAEQLIQP